MADGLNPVIDTNLGPAPMGATGAVGLMSDLAEMRNRQNANILFQQQMTARHQLGEDLAVWGSQGLSPEEQITRASHQPYAPFVTPEIANFRQSNLAGAQVQQTEALINETKQRMYNAGLGPMAQALAATQGDPAKLGSAFKIATAGLPPDLQKSLAPAYSAMLDSITTGLPGDKDAAHAKVQENLRNIGMSFGGLQLDKLYAMGGGVAPTLGEAPTPTGAVQKGVFSGTSFTPATQGGPAASSILGAPAAGSPSTPASGSPIVGPSATQGKFNEARGTDMADYRQRLDTTTSMGAQILKTIEPAWEAMKSAKTGGGAEFYSKLGQIGQAMGLPQDLVDKVANGNLAASQEMQKLMVNTTMGQITQQLPNMSRLAQVEYTSFTANNPNLNTDPRAVEKIFNFWTDLYKQSHEEQTGMDEHLAKGGDISRWPTIWQDIAQKKGYVNTNITGTMEDKDGPTKLPDGAKIWRKNSETGKWE